MRHLLLSGGPAHDFAATSQSLAGLFDESGVATTIVDEPEAAFAHLRAVEVGEAEAFDLLTVNALHWRMGADRYAHLRQDHAFTLESDDAALIGRFVAAGGGLLALHTAVICFDAEPTWRALCGASWNWETSSHRPPSQANVRVTGAGRHHALTEGLDDFVVLDEIYQDLDTGPEIVALLTSDDPGSERPLLWARHIGDGRVVTDLLGHGLESIEHPTHRTILRRAATWLRCRGADRS